MSLQRLGWRCDVIDAQSKRRTIKTTAALANLLVFYGQLAWISNVTCVNLILFLLEILRGPAAAFGRLPAGGDRGVWTTGPCAEVHQLGFKPPLRQPTPLLQGDGERTGYT